jgi:hypothetical protein
MVNLYERVKSCYKTRHNELNLNVLKPVAKQTNKTGFLSKIIALKRIKNFQHDIICKNYRRNTKKRANLKKELRAITDSGL